MKPEAGKHGYSGNCTPGNNYSNQQTFSVGIFQWLPKSSGKGYKKSAVKVRVSGRVCYPEKVYATTEIIIKMLDAEEYNGPKNVKI